MKEENLLTPTMATMRRSIYGIDDSYNNYWDILAELVQNSVDAIRAANREKGKITIDINQLEKTIKVADNGIGIKSDEISILLNPFSTNKTEDHDTIGEKGVGLKFVIFQGNKFELITRHESEEGATRAVINGAKNWLKSDTEDGLKIQKSDAGDREVGTEVTIVCDDVDDDDLNDSYLKLFQMNVKQLIFVLRTKTAIGALRPLFNEPDIPFDIELNVTDLKNRSYNEKIDYSYWLPTESLRPQELCNIDDFKKWLSEGDHTDIEKRKYLRDKAITKYGTETYAGNEIHYWACFFPQRSNFITVSEVDGLITEEEAEELDSNDNTLVMHQPGIYTAIKGMPTGITINNPKTGFAGYWPNVFIMIEDDSLKFDIGRKSIGQSKKAVFNSLSKSIFNEFLNYFNKYGSGDIDPEAANRDWERDEVVEKVKSLPQLNISSQSPIKFEKIPSDQEASVAAIFYEMVGAGDIAFRPLISGYKHRYDLYAYLDDRFTTVEFKSHLREIVKDFGSAKLFNEIDFIVCWDVNDEDTKVLNNIGLTLSEISQSGLLSQEDPIAKKSGATHKLSVATTTKPIYILDLKKILNQKYGYEG